MTSQMHAEKRVPSSPYATSQNKRLLYDKQRVQPAESEQVSKATREHKSVILRQSLYKTSYLKCCNRSTELSALRTQRRDDIIFKQNGRTELCN